MQSLMIRIEMTEEARFQIPDEASFAHLVRTENDLRTAVGNALLAIQRVIEDGEVTNASIDTGAKIEAYRRQLEALRVNPSVQRADQEFVGPVHVLAGYYQALAGDIEQCRRDVEALDWQSWKRSYF